MVDGDGNKRPLPLFRCKDNPSLFSAMQKGKKKEKNKNHNKTKQNKLCGRRPESGEPLFSLSKTFETIDDFFLPC